MCFKRSGQKLCLLLTLCILFLGMCSTTVGGHSVFAPKNTNAVPATVFTDSAIRTQGSHTSAQQAYTREAITQYEVLLTPQHTLRRVNTRMGHRTVLTFLIMLTCMVLAPILSTAFIRHFYDEITINRVIITYIHRQDGEK